MLCGRGTQFRARLCLLKLFHKLLAMAPMKFTNEFYVFHFQKEQSDDSFLLILTWWAARLSSASCNDVVTDDSVACKQMHQNQQKSTWNLSFCTSACTWAALSSSSRCRSSCSALASSLFVPRACCSWASATYSRERVSDKHIIE